MRTLTPKTTPMPRRWAPPNPPTSPTKTRSSSSFRNTAPSNDRAMQQRLPFFNCNLTRTTPLHSIAAGIHVPVLNWAISFYSDAPSWPAHLPQCLTESPPHDTDAGEHRHLAGAAGVADGHLPGIFLWRTNVSLGGHAADLPPPRFAHPAAAGQPSAAHQVDPRRRRSLCLVLVPGQVQGAQGFLCAFCRRCRSDF